MTCLDQRTHFLKAKLKGLDVTLLTGENSRAAEVDGLAEMEGCIEVLETIKRMRGKGKVRVVLVYRERRHRTHHRHQDKGQSNKVVFAREKRDFLSLLGLPGAMISERGLDFSVRPNTATAGKRMAAEAQADMKKQQEEGELEPDEKNGGGAVATEGGSGGEECEVGGSPRRARQLLSRVVPFMKRGSVSPQRQDTPSTNRSRSASIEPQSQSDQEASMCDARSTLSCDSCSSDENSETEDETDLVTDTAVPGTYIHRESLNPASLAPDDNHITLELDKLGLKKTTRLVSPFLRVSVRDSSGGLVWGSSVQETGQWEVVNKHYLKADAKVHIQPTLDDLPNDMAIFLELRHHRPDRGVLSTICYTFLERQDLSSGEFICELYSPPVDYTRKVLHTYTEKAFFLHLSVNLHQPGENNQEEEELTESERTSREGSVEQGDNSSKTSQHSPTPS
ncbi:hypothetical protein Pcinc_010436 [Petrolisthes cinctipes]|uniref:C2 Aida-type domain-containing protein n=1 Tax=Petrolisthes cinctipes TaxID=88211 RepID=A0AAE1G337_PETCI|nr:hypothetical protein Pcinc_010436 [Petrolisthes cinctipes]